MGFNNEYRQFDDNAGFILTGSVEYELGGTTKYADANAITITPGVEVSSSTRLGPSGLCADFAGNFLGTNRITIPHNDLFNRFNSCDRWTISLWVNIDGDNLVFISKGPVRTEQYFDVGEQRILTRTIESMTWPTDISNFPTIDFSNYRTPFIIGSNSDYIYFKCSNGTRELTLSGSRNDGADDTWRHIAVVRDNDFATLYFNGTAVDSGSMPNESTANSADILLGYWPFFSAAPDPISIDEIRMYDYALSTSEIASLSNRHYISASLYQTNVVGNVFYRNGQAVVTSVLPKYNSGSGFFNTAFTASYRGTHTIYENEVLVRVPADQFNYTMNPTATYRPGTDASNNDCNDTTAGAESNNGPGELYLSPFVSGTVGPYITTVGLYNDKAQLLAVGKLGTAITKRPDVDMNFIIRWDY
jgi:hypothetical protein